MSNRKPNENHPKAIMNSVNVSEDAYQVSKTSSTNGSKSSDFTLESIFQTEW